MYLILAILIFGLLIATHELGHFMAAKWSGVKVNEFAIGMGPLLFQREKGETLYSLRALPIGGYCAMEGEDEENDDPRAFPNAPRWKQLVILAAGAGMNFITGLLLIALLYSNSAGFIQPELDSFMEGYGLEDCGLEPGDIFRSIDGHPIYTYSNLTTYLSRAGDEVDFVVERNGQRVVLEDVYMPLQIRTQEDGTQTALRGFLIGRHIVPATFFSRIQFTLYTAFDFVRNVWMSLGDLISGALGIRDMSGPVGIVETMTEIGSSSANAAAAAQNLIYLAAFLAVNLAVMNLLPLPALDGGRILFLALNGILYGLFKRSIPPKYEGYVHLMGMAALLALMLVVTMNDVGRLLGL